MKCKVSFAVILSLLIVSIICIPAFAEGETGLFTLLREDGSGYIYGIDDGLMNEPAMRICFDDKGGIYINSFFERADEYRLYYLSAEKELTLLHKIGFSDNAGSYVVYPFMMGEQLAGFDFHENAIRIFDGNQWVKLVDYDYSSIMNFNIHRILLRGIVNNSIDDKLYITTIRQSRRIAEVDLHTGECRVLETSEYPDAYLINAENGFFFSDFDSRVYRWDPETERESHLFTLPFDASFCDWQDGRILGYSDGCALVWEQAKLTEEPLTIRLAADPYELGDTLLYLHNDEIVHLYSGVMEFIPLDERYSKEKVYMLGVQEGNANWMPFLVETLEDPSVGYYLRIADKDLLVPQLIFDASNEDIRLTKAFFYGMEFYTPGKREHISMRAFDENLQKLLDHEDLVALKWNVRWDDDSGCYLFSTKVGKVEVVVEAERDDMDSPVWGIKLKRSLTISSSSDFDRVLICCYVAMRGNISYEEWRNLERFYDDDHMLPANVAQLLIRDEVPFSYVQQFTYDDFCCEVITIDDDLIGRLWLKPW